MAVVSPLSSVAPLAWLDEFGDGGGESVGDTRHDIGGAVGDCDQGRIREGVAKSLGVGQGEEQVVVGRPCQADRLVEFLDDLGCGEGQRGVEGRGGPHPLFPGCFAGGEGAEDVSLSLGTEGLFADGYQPELGTPARAGRTGSLRSPHRCLHPVAESWRKIRQSRRNATAHDHALRADHADHQVKRRRPIFGAPQGGHLAGRRRSMP